MLFMQHCGRSALKIAVMETAWLRLLCHKFSFLVTLAMISAAWFFFSLFDLQEEVMCLIPL